MKTKIIAGIQFILNLGKNFLFKNIGPHNDTAQNTNVPIPSINNFSQNIATYPPITPIKSKAKAISWMMPNTNLAIFSKNLPTNEKGITSNIPTIKFNFDIKVFI